MEERMVSLREVMDFREEKAAVQMKMWEKYQNGAVVSLGLNIPGPVKSGPSFDSIFFEGRRSVEQMLRETMSQVADVEVLKRKAGYAAVYAVIGTDASELKRHTVFLEENHPLGRIWDIDILGKNAAAVDRGQIGAQQRKCLLCNADAKVCARSRKHTVEELQEKISAIIRSWEEHEA